MQKANDYAEQMHEQNPESEMHPADAVEALLTSRGSRPKVTGHFFTPGSAGHEAECGVGVPDVEWGAIVGTTCGYREEDHIQAER